MSIRSCLAIVSGLAVAAGVYAAAPAVEFPVASPACTLKQRVGLTDIEINYSRPGVKNRTIYGGLVPFDQVWRTGANSSTKITFSTPVKFGGADVPAGTYALYTIPSEKEWTIILSKNTTLWGAFGYDARDDLVRVQATPVPMGDKVETFTIDVNDLRDESATLELIWENTRVPVPIQVNFVDQLVAQIEKVMATPGGEKPYQQAADFYFTHNLDLQKARTWVEAAVAERDDAYWSLNLQAKILAKLGDKAGAIAAARRSLELATAAGDSSYVRSDNEIIAELQ